MYIQRHIYIYIYIDVHVYIYIYTHTSERRISHIWTGPFKHPSTLQHSITPCNTLQHTATHCNSLQHTATHYNTQVWGHFQTRRAGFERRGSRGTCQNSVLPCVAMCCSVLQPVAVSCYKLGSSGLRGNCRERVLQCVAVCCSVSHFVAVCRSVCCSVLQRVASCCSVLQCVGKEPYKCRALQGAY